MSSLDQLYKKFGEASEAGQLLESELRALLISGGGDSRNFCCNPNPELAKELLGSIDNQSLGELLSQLGTHLESRAQIEILFTRALKERKRLNNTFFCEHGVKRNSAVGRGEMFADLEMIHKVLTEAYKAALILSVVETKEDHLRANA